MEENHDNVRVQGNSFFYYNIIYCQLQVYSLSSISWIRLFTTIGTHMAREDSG